MRKWQLLGGGLLVGLILAEGVCRLTIPNPITGPQEESRASWRVSGLVSDPLVEYSFQPGYQGRMSVSGDYDVPFRINAQGLRSDVEYTPRHPGRSRILLVGDSFVFGNGVELQDTLGAQLERALNADGTESAPVEVVPVGVPGYGLDDYARLIQRWVPLVQPDLVVVGFFPGNDLIDYELDASDKYVVIDGGLVRARQAWNWGLRKYSVLAHLLLQRFNPIQRIDRARPLDPKPQDITRIYQTILPWVKRLAEAPGRGGPPVAIWVIAGKDMVEAQRNGRPGYTLPPLAGVLRDLRKAGCTVFDPTEAWLAAPEPVSQYYFPRDAHYSAIGTRFMAEWLAPRLRETFGARLVAQPVTAQPNAAQPQPKTAQPKTTEGAAPPRR